MCCYLWGPRGGAVNLDIPYFSLLLLVAFVFKHNLDDKNMRNIDVIIHLKLELQEIDADLTYPPCGFNEQLRYICESNNRDFFRPTPKKLTHAKV